MAAMVGLSLLGLAIPRVRVSIIEHRDEALTAAAHRGDVWSMRLLRIAGADLKRPGPGNGPPIVAAGWTGKTEVLRYLLDNGVDVNQRDKFGYTALIEASGEGHLDAVRYLVSRNANLNANGEDGTALRRARERGRAEVASFSKLTVPKIVMATRPIGGDGRRTRSGNTKSGS